MLIRIISKEGIFSEVTINKDIITVGRDTSNDININDEKVSRNHLIIVKENDALKVTDCSSRNGTIVNSLKINPNIAYPLSISSQIKIGDTTLNIIETGKEGSSNTSGGSKIRSLVPIFIVLPLVIITVLILSIMLNMPAKTGSQAGTTNTENSKTSVTDSNKENMQGQQSGVSNTDGSQNSQTTTQQNDLGRIIEIMTPSIVEIAAGDGVSGNGVYGSGTVYKKNGYILTNNHVIEGAKKIVVRDLNQKSYEAQVIAAYPEIDIALIKVNSSSFTAPQYGDSSKLKTGNSIIAIGNPYGLTNTVTTGIVSAIRDLPDDKGNIMIPGIIQHDAALNQGNSGGPLINYSGEIVGINSFMISSNETSSGLGFAIPVNVIIDHIKNDLNILPDYYGNIKAVTETTTTETTASAAASGQSEETTQGVETTTTQKVQFANDFSLKDMAGNTISISAFQGKTIVLNFFATWCPPCVEEIPFFIKVYNSYKNRNVQFIGISLDSDLNALKNFISEKGINYPVIIDDGKVSNIWGINAIPTTFILDRNGNKIGDPKVGSMTQAELTSLLDNTIS
jgi:Trypsin-like serine proteases, typically periplasmic, contain C-terminal PDZ domain